MPNKRFEATRGDPLAPQAIRLAMMNPRTTTLVAGGVVSIIAMQSLGLFGGGAPTIASPASMLLVIPAFMGVPPLLVVMVLVGLFLVWRPSLFSGRPEIPVRTVVLLVVATVLSAFVFVAGWEYGYKYQGPGYTQLCLVLSILTGTSWTPNQLLSHFPR